LASLIAYDIDKIFIACDIVYDNFQAGMIPNPDREMAGLFSRSEEMLQDHCKLYATSKAELKDLIQKVNRIIWGRLGKVRH